MKAKMLCTMMLLGFFSNSLAQDNVMGVIPDGKEIKYNKMIFGHFIEHFDDQVYGGLFDPSSKFADEDGFRVDVIEALKQIQVPIVRWPGGCFVSSYHWYYGVGKERTPVYDKAWQVEDPNTFGTDEFVKWCRKIGCEPFICTNAGTGTAEEMSDWVEYCNLNIGKFGRERIANGYPEPHNVMYWSIGNENWGAHELGAKSIQEWGPLVRESAKLMRSVTKDAKLFAAATSNKNWTLPLLREAGHHLDYVSIHGYWNMMPHRHTPDSYLECMMKTDAPERDILQTIDILEEAGFGNGKIKIAYDEWNLRSWHHPWHGLFRDGFDLEARRKNDIASTYTMADALFSACFLNACLRHSDIVDIACFSPIVNTRGAIFVHPEGILKRTTYHVFDMYVNLLEDYMVPTSLQTSLLSNGNKQTGILDGVLTANEKGTKYAYVVVNKNPKEGQQLKLDFDGMKIKPSKNIRAKVLTGKTPDDYNEIGAENRVVPKDVTLKVKDGCVELPPHSLTVLFLE